MKTFLPILLGFVIGGVVGAVGGGVLGASVGAGVGSVTGRKAGPCLTLEAARTERLIRADQQAGPARAAARQFASEDLPEGPGASAIDCAAVFAELRKAATCCGRSRSTTV
jgi:hypothetical protein